MSDTPTHAAHASDHLLSGLNPSQREAVLAVEGPVLVVAGAGSGKTRVLTHRIAHLIQDHGVDPFAILAITFTNKAASEMADRVGALLGTRLGQHMWVTTFHKACVRILRREAKRLGYASAFTIYDEADSVRLVTQIMKDLGIDDRRLTPKGVRYAISAAKDELIDFETYASAASGFLEERIAEVYRTYQDRLLRASAFDFDDLITKTVEVLRLFPEVLEHYRHRFRYLLVDEYQDTNRAQYHLVNDLASEHRNLMVVGDGDQSIYRFRGATIQNLLDFERDYPEATVIKLTRNYRSTQNILDAANAVIRNNQQRQPKELWTDAGVGPLVVRYEAEDEHDEAAFVAEEVEKLRAEGEHGFDDVAVFYRTNAQSRVLEEVFVRVGTPYRVIGGVRFYERKEIKDVLAYLRVLVNPADDINSRRIVNTPRRGIGQKTVDAVAMHARREGIAFLDACRAAEHIPQLGGRAVSAVTSFVNLIDLLRTLMVEGATVDDLVEEVWSRTGYLAELQAERSIEALGREENLRELKSVAQEYVERDPEGGVEGFLESVTLVSDQDELDDDDEGQVTLMTLHTAKGLEFPVVFLVGLEDGVFPHVRSLDTPSELEEERRLCYVGLTRAEQRLYLTHASHRTLWGGTSYNPPSRFLAEVPEELVELRRAGGGSAAQRVRDREVVSFEGEEFRVGDRVRHPRYGAGVIVRLAGQGENTEATVVFEDEGQKQLLLAYAPLVRT
ncbi:MAG: DNA helicase PcrA [Actinobacteria bacterium]|nr:DNA helicase PcrA [Actinomycetota bacterium]